MKLWGYYAVHTFWNSVKKMFRSSVVVVIFGMFCIFGIFGLAGGVAGTLIEDELSENQPAAEDREGYGDSEYGYYNDSGEFLFYDDLYEDGLGGWDEEGNFIYYEDAYEQGLGYYDEAGDFIFYYEELTEEDVAQIMLVVETIAAIIVLVILVLGARSGMKQGSDIFMMADVNFLFTAPMKPQSVLLFRLTFQMLAIFAGTIYLLFQIPNLVINLNLSIGTCFVIYFSLILALIVQKVLSVGMYTYTATHENVKKFVTPIAVGLGIVLTVVTLFVYYLTGDVWKTLEYTWASAWSRCIPVAGWIKAIIFHAIQGNTIAAGVYFVLTLAGIAGLTYLVWQMKADFYEDAMTGAQAREDLLLAVSENRKAVEVKTEKGKKKDKRKTGSELAPILEKAKGAQVFLAKELLVRRRLARFGVVTTTMLWYFVIGTGLSWLNVFVFETQNFALIGFIFMAILFFRNYGNPIEQETSMNWLFLVPESPYKKVFYSMAAGTCATILDLFPAMLTATIMMKLNPVVVLLWYFVLITMDFMLSGVGLLLEAIFPASALDVVKSMIQMVLKFVVIIFIVGAIVIGVVIGSLELGLIINLIMNIVIGIVTFMIYPAMLHEGIS